MVTIKKKVDNNITYVRKQITLFLQKHYRLKVNIKVYANKELKKSREYSRTTFPKSVHGDVEVDIEYMLMGKGKKQQVLETAFREAVRIGLWRTGRGYKDNHPEYEAELRKYGLPSYGGVAEMGLELHTYGCRECKSVWALKEKKLQKSKDPEQMGLKTKCCRGDFEYTGKVFYDNRQLQDIRRSRGV